METVPHALSLKNLSKGRLAHIATIDETGSLSGERLRELGFAEGMKIEVLHTGILGGPMIVKVGAMRVALRRGDAALVEVFGS